MTTTTATQKPVAQAADEQIDAKKRAKLATGGLVLGLATTTIFAVAYIGGLHKPTPHDVPIGVVGAVPPAVEKAFAGTLEFHIQPNRAALLDTIHARKVIGGIEGRTAYVASGESFATAAFLTALFKSKFSSVRVVETAPLQDGDPRGLSLFYLVI